jgi:hypothetical protein
MAKHVIFMVHGIGDFKSAKAWHDSYKDLLPELYKGYEFAEFLPFDELFELKPVFYNDEFQRLRKQWATAAAEVADLMTPGKFGLGALQQVTEWAGSANKDDFVRTHILDVILYRFFPDVAGAVRASVHKQLMEGIKGAKSWSVVAHSLGTSVTHDSLVWMFDGRAPDGKLPPEGFRMEALAMIANVSRVLESSGYVDEDGNNLNFHWDAYRSVVQPNAKITKGVCSRFLNVRHTWDPVPLPKQFKPAADWPDAATRASAGAFLDIQIDEIEDIEKLADIHDLGHYLRNPRVHIPLFRSLLPIKGLIPPEEEKKKVDAHVASTPLAKVKQKIEDLKKFRLSDEEDDWQKILKAIHGLLDS